MKIHFLKTVWSDMIILEDNHHFAIVDTGMEDQYEELASYLDSVGAETIDFILLTHFHRDHYGNICNLVKNYDVKKVYFKEYGGHDRTTAWGSEADEDYRQSEVEKWHLIRDCIAENSSLEMVESVSSIAFEGTTLHLYANENAIQKMWEDVSHPETYHQNVFSENQNSLAVFFEVNGKTVFLGGDMMDCASSHPLSDYATLRVAKQIGKEIYLYKAPHHGTKDTSCNKTLEIFKPQVAVITNGKEWLDSYSTVDELKSANPNVEILLTELNDVIVEL